MTNLSNIVEVLAKQALGGNQQASGQGGLGGILGSVLGQMGGNTSSGAQGGFGGVLGSVLGQVTGNNNTPQAGGGVQSLLIAVVPLILGWVQQQGEPYRVCRRVNILRDYPDDKIKIYP
ncbi:Uncharacterised protein [Acinetobacter baumannii]|nr:Uncharacterised protein [Acinetobacter baumannii]